MLESLFKYPAVQARHRNAPFFEERDRYLRHRAKQGCAHETLLRIARELPLVVQLLDMPSKSLVTAQHIKWGEEHDHPWAAIQISDVDAFLSSRNDKGWCRVSIATSAKALKAFFHYAGQHCWCHPMIAPAIQGPRLFSQDSLPSGPSWKEFERLIGCMTPDQPRDIRDRAIILLFALYGLRSSEVARLRLEDIAWESSRLSVYRSKQRKAQIYPLTSTVGHAIIRYLRTVRQQSSHREIFLTLKAPLRPLSGGGLYNIVSRCIASAEVQTRHTGPHALRHACAMHLISAGLSLKEIGDHLGHSSTSATRI